MALMARLWCVPSPSQSKPRLPCHHRSCYVESGEWRVQTSGAGLWGKRYSWWALKDPLQQPMLVGSMLVALFKHELCQLLLGCLASSPLKSLFGGSLQGRVCVQVTHFPGTPRVCSLGQTCSLQHSSAQQAEAFSFSVGGLCVFTLTCSWCLLWLLHWLPVKPKSVISSSGAGQVCFAIVLQSHAEP